MATRFLAGVALVIVFVSGAYGQTGQCNARQDAPSMTIGLPGQPFGVAVSGDGCWVYVSLMGKNPGIAVLKRKAGRVELSRVVPLKWPPAGITMTHDGKLLIAAALNGVVFVDLGRMEVLGSFSDGPQAQSIYVNVTADDKLLFVSEESARSITVIDLAQARGNGYRADAIIGKIPVGNAPIALTFSPDGKWLYTTSQGALNEWGWPKACKAEGRGAGSAELVRPEGAVIVVDVARAKTNPAAAVMARIPAGCSPVRMAISPDGGRIYVTARNSDSVLALDTGKLLTDAAHARVGMELVGAAPVPVAVVDGGRKVVAGNSNRFAGGMGAQSLTVLDAAKMEGKSGARLGSIPAGGFPREMSVSADGRTLFLTNFGSNSLQVMDVARLIP